MSKEQTISLKEHLKTIIKLDRKHGKDIRKQKDMALNAALISMNDRLALLNELRSGVATKDQLQALEKTVEDLKTSRDTGVGKGIGNKDVMEIIKLVIVIAGFLLGYFVFKH